MKKKFLFIMLSVSLIFTGCSAKSYTTSKVSNETTSAETSSTTTAEATKATTKKAELVLPTTQNTSGKVQIQTVSSSASYKFNSYIITSSKGESIIVDPTSMPSKDTIDLKPAAIVCTHNHPDHTDSTFTDSYDCQKILYTKADIKTTDFHIYSILSSHNGDEITEGNENYIMVFEVDGLRIAHMGDLGQNVLTNEQLKELGNIDIAFMQFDNSYSDIYGSEDKVYNLIGQFNPKVVIPTHYESSSLPIIEGKYGKISDYSNILQISKADLPEKSLTFYRILNTHKYF